MWQLGNHLGTWALVQFVRAELVARAALLTIAVGEFLTRKAPGRRLLLGSRDALVRRHRLEQG